jgi:hypothetical protein
MKHVFKLFEGNPSQLDTICDTEVLFKVGDDEMWMPIQPQILKALKKESRKGDELNIYCVNFNEHNSNNRLFNTFLISEFSK